LAYESENSGNYSLARLEGFPLELLPVNLAIQRSKGSAFTNSFVAGVYRDTRMGLEELRATRRARLKKKHDAIGAAKGAVAADIARLQALAALAAKRQVDRQRRRYEAMLFQGALVLQSVYRKRRARVRAAGPSTWHVLIIQERIALVQACARRRAACNLLRLLARVAPHQLELAGRRWTRLVQNRAARAIQGSVLKFLAYKWATAWL
jgi:hypothetical protein